MRRFDLLSAALGALAAAMLAPSVAQAHCCHDSRMLGVAQQSEFRRGMHGAGDGGLSDESIQADPPDVGRRLDDRNGQAQGTGRYGSMRGNGLGNYGAGSIGERGPGGLGAMTGSSLNSGPVNPR